MIAKITYDIVSGVREYRWMEARKVTVAVPGLGDFESTDDHLWFGEVDDLQLTLRTNGGPPSALQASIVQNLLKSLPPFVELAKQYIAQHEDTSWLTGGIEAFEVLGIEPQSTEDFEHELVHPADWDGQYRVQFNCGVPVNSGRDD